MYTPRQYIAAADLLDRVGDVTAEDILGSAGLSGATAADLDALMRETARVAPMEFIAAVASADA